MSQAALLPTESSLASEEVVEEMQLSNDCLPLRRVMSHRHRRMSKSSSAFDYAMSLSPTRAWSPASRSTSPCSSPSSPCRPSSPLSFRAPSSPRDHYLRKRASLSMRPSTSQADNSYTGQRSKVTTRLRSTSSHYDNPPNILEGIYGKGLRRRSVDSVIENKTGMKHMEDAEEQARSGRKVKPGTHFRPVAYEVKAELDSFFGQTKSQKRELALRTRGEDGRLWFDGAEQEEFAHLLRAQPDSPLSKSRRSSAATSACLSPTTNRPRGSSVLTSNPLVAASPNFQDVTAFTYLSMQQLQLQHQAQHPNQATSYRRRKRNSCDLVRGNKVIADEPMHAHQTGLAAEIMMEGQRGKSRSDIVMPAFLPLRRHQADSTFLDEAFASTCATAHDATDRGGAVDDPFDQSLSKPQGQRKHRPAGLYLAKREQVSDALPRRRLERPLSLVCTPREASDPFDSLFDEKETALALRRRGSSFDSASPARVRFEYCDPFRGGPVSPVSPWTPVREQDKGAKAATLLGKNPLNENLLVPGGLPTGLHVYDGLEIPCRSVHLASDDEEDEGSDDKLKSKRSRSALRTWLRGKAGA